MDTRKVTFIATIAAIVLVAVGIGYAYTAMTTNSGNSSTVENITLVQGGDGAYTFATGANVVWNSDDGKTDGKYYTTYTLAPSATPIDDITVGSTTYKVVQIGKSFTVRAAQTGGELETINGMITANGFNKQVEGAEIFLEITPAGGSATYYKLFSDNTFIRYDSGWTDNTFTIPYNSGFKDLTVKVYYGTASTGVKVEHAAGHFPVGPSGTPISTPGSLIFTAFKPGINGANESISTLAATPSGNINVGGSTTITATTVPATGVTVSLSSTNANVASVAGNSVTGVHGGKAVIIATAENSGYSKVMTVTVNPQVTFDGNGSTSDPMSAQNFTYGAAVALDANTYEMADCTFDGWNTAADGSGISYTDGQSLTLTSDLTLYAQWVENQPAP